MPSNDLSPVSKRLTILIGLSVIGAMAFGLSISFYRNILFEETLKEISLSNRELRADIDNDLEELAYYRSHQYRDKYAKENLGRLNPGEKILILTERHEEILSEEENGFSWKEEREAAYRQYLENIPVVEHWRLYLFDTSELEKLKRTF